MGFTLEGLLSCNYTVFAIPQVGHGPLCSHSVGCKDVSTKAPPSDVEFLRTLGGWVMGDGWWVVG